MSGLAGNGVSPIQSSAVSTENLESTIVDPLIYSIETTFSESPHARNLDCESCHTVIEETVTKELAWSDEKTGLAEPVTSAQDLCIKCHANQEGADVLANGSPTAHPDFGCTNCHNAHNAQASCTQSTCHSDIQIVMASIVEKPENHPTEGDPNNYMCGGTSCHDLARKALASPIYHQPTHRQVPCTVCHDASGMKVEKVNSQEWVTLPDFDTGGGDQQAATSHNLGREVACQKCHSFNNSWNLVEITPTE